MEKIGRNEPCWCGSNKKYKKCHEAFDQKIVGFRRDGNIVPTYQMIKTKEQIDGIRESGKVNIAILDYIAEKITIGMSTEEIDRLVYEKTKAYGAIPAPLGYGGFPKSVCTSRNNQVCHGIPSKKDILQEGDIINVDVSTLYRGFYSDSSRMFCLGNTSAEAKRLVHVAKESITVGLGQVRPWNLLGNMGSAIHEYVIQQGYSVVDEMGGHGVGVEFHEEPFVSYVSKQNTGMVMAPGMVFTIEPMVNMGQEGIYTDQKDHWIVYTRDGSLSAQWEVTVAVTENGYEILAY